MSSRRQVLLDSNPIIYATTDPQGTVAAYLAKVDPIVSVVTRIEVLGFHGLTSAHKAKLESYFNHVTVVGLEDVVADRAIALRQIRRMSLGDSVIAATAMAYELPLVTRNTRDFSWITSLAVVDPLAPDPEQGNP